MVAFTEEERAASVGTKDDGNEGTIVTGFRWYGGIVYRSVDGKFSIVSVGSYRNVTFGARSIATNKRGSTVIIPALPDATGKLNPDGTTPTPILIESGIIGTVGEATGRGSEESSAIVKRRPEDTEVRDGCGAAKETSSISVGTGDTSATVGDGIMVVTVGTVVWGGEEWGIVEFGEGKGDTEGILSRIGETFDSSGRISTVVVPVTVSGTISGVETGGTKGGDATVKGKVGGGSKNIPPGKPSFSTARRGATDGTVSNSI